MAEGDSIHRIARRLNSTVNGRTVETSDFRIAALATVDLASFEVVETKAVGKHLLTRLANGRRLLSLHSHLRMQGAWNFFETGKRPPRKRIEEVRVMLRFTDETSLVGFSIPVVDLVETAREADVVGHLGPDLLTDYKMGEATERLLRTPEAPVVQALLDQRNVAGIGNLWAVETCFLRGLYPWAPIAEVDVAGALRLVTKMMRHSLDVRSGMTTTGIPRKGKNHWVYGRYNKPCMRCTTPVAFSPGGSGPYDREVWWCRSCQPR